MYFAVSVKERKKFFVAAAAVASYGALPPRINTFVSRSSSHNSYTHTHMCLELFCIDRAGMGEGVRAPYRPLVETFKCNVNWLHFGPVG